MDDRLDDRFRARRSSHASASRRPARARPTRRCRSACSTRRRARVSVVRTAAAPTPSAWRSSARQRARRCTGAACAASRSTTSSRSDGPAALSPAELAASAGDRVCRRLRFDVPAESRGRVPLHPGPVRDAAHRDRRRGGAPLVLDLLRRQRSDAERRRSSGSTAADSPASPTSGSLAARRSR